MIMILVAPCVAKVVYVFVACVVLNAFPARLFVGPLYVLYFAMDGRHNWREGVLSNLMCDSIQVNVYL